MGRKGWTISAQGLFYYARKGNVVRRFDTRGALSDFLNTL